MSNVEFVRSGQEGYTDFFDPRYSVAFSDLGDTTLNARPSYVKYCAFHEGYNAAVGAFGANNLRMEGNVIYRTVERGMYLYSYGGNVIYRTIERGIVMGHKYSSLFIFSIDLHVKLHF